MSHLRQRGALLGLLVALTWPALLFASPHAVSAARPAGRQSDAGQQPYAVRMRGRIVRFGLSGFEPDFDPIDRVIASSQLHDPRLPDTMLVLSMYYENFQPSTTPVLPDLLDPNQQATALGGFMQGKAILVTRSGSLAYQGSLLAEVFLDNSVHAIVDLYRNDTAGTTLRLKGTFTLHKDLSLDGRFASARPLTPSDLRLLRTPGNHPVSWQSVVAGLKVQMPKMVGTGGSGTAPTTPPPSPRPSAAAAAAPSPSPAPTRVPAVIAPTRPSSGAGSVPARLVTAAALVVALAGLLTWFVRATVKPRRAAHQ